MEESEEHSHSLGRSNSLSRSPSPIHSEQNRSNNSLDYSEERQNGSNRSGSYDGNRHSLSPVNRSPLYSYQNQSNHNLSHSAGYDSDEVRSYAPTSPTTLDPIKRKRLRIKVSREDRISALPDSIIHQILSLLPAEDAVKTGVLSKRWMYVWTAVPNLAFRHPYCNRFSAFFKFVDQFLFFYSPGKMEKFELDFDYYRGKREGLDSSIHKWLRLVTKHDASEISLHLCPPDWSNHMLVLSVLEFRGLNSPLHESRCKCLTLNTDFKEWDTYALVSVLQNMHSLEELVIDRTSSRQGEDVFFLNPTDFGLNYWESEGKTTSSCLLKHLKTVEIVGVEPFDDDIQEHLLAFVQYLLGNAAVLEKMVLIRTAEQHWRKDDILYVTQKLLRFPRCSQAAVLFS